MSIKFPQIKMLNTIVLMQLSTKGSMHGYALTTEIEKFSGWKPSQTAIYNSLKTLEAEEAVSCEERIENGRLQKIYTITQKGIASLAEVKKKIQPVLMNILTNYYRMYQHINEKDPHDELKLLLDDFRQLSRSVLTLSQIAPVETHKIVLNTLETLQKLAEEKKVKLENSSQPFQLNFGESEN